MSFARGERVVFDLDADFAGQLDPQEDQAPSAPSPAAFVGDILERNSSAANPPIAPEFKTNAAGFPVHKKRTPRVSTFRQQKAAKNEVPTTAHLSNVQPKATQAGGMSEEEKRSIDQENQQRLAAMSEQEIEEERRELLSSLSPGLIQKLLGRADISDGSNEHDWDQKASAPPADETGIATSSPIKKKVTFETLDEESPGSQVNARKLDTSASVSEALPELDPSIAAALENAPSSIHFPKPPPQAELDPNSDSFLTDLRDKYFPDLPYNPSSVSWMQPVDPSDTTSPYHPSQDALNPSELRFDFKGNLLAPSAAREIPTTEGLHHHGDAPEAAGYTIPELAILSRSAVPAQRCVAYQTLGRVLYRLGQGEFGVEEAPQRVAQGDGPVGIVKDPNMLDDDEEWEEESVGSAMAKGLWECIEEGRVIETLTEEAGRERGHLTARTYAQEALWNWRRGGGRKKRAV